MKNSFVMYSDWTPLMANLPDESAGKLIKAIFAYQVGEEVSIDDPILASVFEMIRAVMDKDNEKYEQVKSARSEAGKKNKANQTPSNDNKSKQKLSNDNKANQTPSIADDNDNDNDNDNVNVNVYVNDNGNGNGNVNDIPPKSPKGDREAVQERNFSPELEAVVFDWLKYKREKRQPYKQTGLKSLLTQIENNSAEYGERAVIEIMRRSMSNGYQGITWDWLKQERWRNGVNSGRFKNGDTKDDGWDIIFGRT